MSKLTDYKALLFDIDGTLTNNDRVITDEVIDNLKQLAELGYKIGICSGRGFSSILYKIIPLFPNDAIHIVGGGSEIISSSGEVIWEHPIDPDTIQELKDQFSKSEVISIFMKPEAQYTSGEALVNMRNHPWKFIVKETSEMTNDGVGLIYVTNLNQKIRDLITNNPKISYKQMTGGGGNEYLDVTAKGINKSGAVKRLAKHLNITTKQIIGFGDSLNDIEFLETCGFSVAMGNALDEVKEIADITIGHVNDNALATYLSNIIKGDSL